MLNISPNSITKQVHAQHYSALEKAESKHSRKVLRRLLFGVSLLSLIIMFFPWTQNIRAEGNVTTLQPDKRPQGIQSVIGGRIEKWYVREGDHVEKGDTILFISEVKPEYFDTNLVDRTKNQVDLKKKAIASYYQKLNALKNQKSSLEDAANLKISQAKNKVAQNKLKVQSDSADLASYEINFKIAKDQYDRIVGLYEQGLKSKTDMENRENKMQKARAEMVAAENKFLTSQNELLNSLVELTSLRAQYDYQISKVASTIFETESMVANAETNLSKMEIQLANYSRRNGMYYITAPQTGYVTKAIQGGIGETIKEGDNIVTIMPDDYELAIAMYVEPIDLPLIEKGQHVRIQFDGWPAIVFSGWPNVSYGTYGGEVFAIDNFISENGKYRILVKQDPKDHKWPKDLRVGAGTKNMLLLKDVPVWYELWRQMNGFPPDYYKTSEKPKEKVKRKIKIK
jgi:multidrug resistance efflux pump